MPYSSEKHSHLLTARLIVLMPLFSLINMIKFLILYLCLFNYLSLPLNYKLHVVIDLVDSILFITVAVHLPQYLAKSRCPGHLVLFALSFVLFLYKCKYTYPQMGKKIIVCIICMYYIYVYADKYILYIHLCVYIYDTYCILYTHLLLYLLFLNHLRMTYYTIVFLGLNISWLCIYIYIYILIYIFIYLRMRVIL